MKVNKVVFLSFPTNSTEATTYININFPVKSIHTKSIIYQTGGNIPANSQLYLTLVSDLTNGEPLGFLYNDTDKAPTIPFCDISFQPYKPETINGTYTFKLLLANGSPYTAPFDDYVNVILEFNGVDTENH